MIGYIYKTTNLINNKFYIGQHQKTYFDNKYLGSGRIIKKAILKYGKNNFKCEIIEKCYTIEELNTKEIYYIDKLKPNYNIAKGGLGGLGNKFNLSDEAKNKISIAHKGKKKNYEIKGCFKKGNVPWNKGKPWNNNTLEKLRIANKDIHKQQRWINNGVDNKFINVKYMDDYLNKGWVKGRIWKTDLDKYKEKMKNSITEAHKNGKINTKGKFCWVKKNNLTKMIPKSELSNYICEGWSRGRGSI